MNINGSNQNCQLRKTRRNTVESQLCFLWWPSRVTAMSFSSAVKYQAVLWIGRLGMTTQPTKVRKRFGIMVVHIVPRAATGMVMTETITKTHRHAGSPPLPSRDSIRPAWIHPPAMLPRCPKQQKIAALVLSSDFLYQEPYMKCAPTLKWLVSNLVVTHGWYNSLSNSGKCALKSIQNEQLVDMLHTECNECQHTPRYIRSHKYVFWLR